MSAMFDARYKELARHLAAPVNRD